VALDTKDTCDDETPATRHLRRDGYDDETDTTTRQQAQAPTTSSSETTATTFKPNRKRSPP